MTVSKRPTTDHYLAADLQGMAEIQENVKHSNTHEEEFPRKIIWERVLFFIALHIAGLIGLYQLIVAAKWPTVAWTFFCAYFGGTGVTMGAHRLWTHRSYKAVWPLRVILIVAETMAFLGDVISWARDHRCHHKWTDTAADPHNINRGFFFSHMGWMMVKKHPEVKRRGDTLDHSDLYADPMLRFQHKYYLPLVVLISIALPTFVACYFWDEKISVAFYTAVVFRYCYMFHCGMLINSAAHTFGYKPYDKDISPAENATASLLAMGEGGHNFHHTFPQDYRTSEWDGMFNLTKVIIDGCASVGLIYDRKLATEQAIERQRANVGDMKM